MTGRAILDTHVVRTMPETVLTVVEPDGRLRMALVLQFGEPPDYLPRDGWMRGLEGEVPRRRPMARAWRPPGDRIDPRRSRRSSKPCAAAWPSTASIVQAVG